MMPVAIVFFVLALVLIGFIIVSVLLAVKLASVPDVSRSTTYDRLCVIADHKNFNAEKLRNCGINPLTPTVAI